MAKNISNSIGIPLNILFLIGCIFLLLEVTKIRTEELGDRINKFDEGSGSRNASELISRYRLLKDSSKESEKSYIAESRLLATMSMRNFAKTSKNHGLLRGPAILLLNSLSLFTGADPVESGTASKARQLTELGYLFERKRNYSKAIKLYSMADALTKNKDDKAYIYIHRG